MKPQYINRDLSLLDFNRRVLQEAADRKTPILERVTFLGITANNLDEFYQTRIAGLERLAVEQGPDHAKDLREELLYEQVNAEMAQLQKEFGALFDSIKKELESLGVEIIDETKLSDSQKEFVKHYFESKVRPAIMPVLLEKISKPAFLKDKATYLVARLSSSKSDRSETDLLIEVPVAELSRFVLLPKPAKGNKIQVMFLDDVIRLGIPSLLTASVYDRCEAYSIKFNRDAEIEIDAEPGNHYLDDVRKILSKRKSGQFVRLVYDQAMPKDLLEKLVAAMEIKDAGILKQGEKYNNFKDFMGFSSAISSRSEPSWNFEPLPPLPCKDLPKNRRILDVVREKDVILHYPYQSFGHIIDLLLQSSVDPDVKAIKMTIYRAAKNSRIIAALINAARNGKKVTVYIELKASFDEEANIDWASKMKAEGIRIVYRIPGNLKVHSKLILIRRKEGDKKVNFAAIGTGNPNESTSKFYSDEHLLTSNPDLTGDVAKIFKILETKNKKKSKKSPDFKSLVVSPYTTRKHFIAMLERETQNAEEGKPAWAVIKLNNLVDKKIIDAMYKASKAGVEIQCIIRGMCCLVPGVPGLSENIKAIRIVDRFLEHARILMFCADGKEEIYIGSADWMGRNFDERIEVCAPIVDPAIKEQLQKILELQLADNVKGIPIGDSEPTSSKSGKKISSQLAIYLSLSGKGLIIS